jgi:DNA repair protein RecO (recombination protein O)
MIEKTHGYIISRRIYRDTSLVLKIYTRDFGKLEGIVKGVRKIESYGRYDGLIDLFSEYEVVFYRRRSDLKLFVQFYLLNSYWELTQDYRAFYIANSGFELLDFVMPPEQPNKDVYELIEDFLSHLIKKSSDSYYYSFLLKLLKFSGFKPHIDECLSCRKKVFKKGYFSVSEGGLICFQCKDGRRNLRAVSPGVIRSIIFLEQKPWADVIRLKLTPEVKKELYNLLKDFVGFHLNYIPRTWELLDRERLRI